MLGFNNFSFSMGILLVVSSFFFKTESYLDVRIAQEYYFVFFVSNLFFLSRKDPRKYIFLFLTAIPFFTLKSFNQPMMYFQWLMIILGFMLIIICIESDIDRNLLINVLSIICILQSIWMTLEYFQVDIGDYLMRLFTERPVIKMKKTINGLVPYKGPVKVLGSLGQQTLSGVIPATLFITLFRKYWFTLIPLPIFAVYASGSANCFASMIVVISIYLLLKYKTKILGYLITSTLITTGLIYHFKRDFFYAGERFRAWKEILESIGHTFLGKGPGYLYLYSRVVNNSNQVFKQAHNEFIDAYVIWGYAGLICILILAIHFFMKAEKHKLLYPIMFGLVFNSFFNLTFHLSSLSLIAILIYTNITRGNHGKEKST